MIGENIKKARMNAKMSQRELAKKINKTGQFISLIENGKNNPSYDTLFKIAEVLNVTPNELLNDDTISKKLIDKLEYPLLKIYGVVDTLDILSDELNVDYDTLENSLDNNIELPMDIQIKLLELLAQIDYYEYLRFIDENKDIVFNDAKFKNKIKEITIKHSNDKNKLDNHMSVLFEKAKIDDIMENFNDFSVPQGMVELKKQLCDYINFAYETNFDKIPNEFKLTKKDLNHLYKETIEYIDLLTEKIKKEKELKNINNKINRKNKKDKQHE